MKIATSVVHAPWIPERVETMKQLRESLAVEIPTMNVQELPAHSFANNPVQPAFTPMGPFHEETVRGKSWVWQEDQFRWFASTDADWFLVLQDDQSTPSAQLFWTSILSMLQGCAHDVVCFHAGHPAARGLFKSGEVAYTTNDGLVGQAYAMKRYAALDYLAFRANELVPEVWDYSALNGFARSEDNMIGLYCMTRGIKIWHPIPTLVDHNIEIASTNPGYDGHLYRASQVTWRDAHRTAHPIEWNSPDRWARKPVHLGLFYGAETGIHMYAPVLLRDRAHGEEIARYLAKDICPVAYRRFFHRLSAA